MDTFNRFRTTWWVKTLTILFWMVQIGLIVAKIGGWLDWSWWWVFSPILFLFMGAIALGIIALLLVLLLTGRQ